MLRNIFFTSLLFLIVQSSVAQRFDRIVGWPPDSIVNSNLKSVPKLADQPIYLKFDGNLEYPNQESMLPYFYEAIPISNGIIDISQVSVTLTNKLYKPLTDNEIKATERVSNSLIKKQEELFNVYQSRGVSYLQVRIPAIRVNPVSNILERLEQFSIEVSEKKGIEFSRVFHKTATQSVLAQGVWKMIKVDKSGIYRISYAELQSMGLSNPENVSIWGHGGKQLSFWNSDPSPDDLMQIPIWMEKGSDGVFNQGDYILFYAEGPITWAINENDSIFSHSIHDYADQIHYFVTTNQPNPLRISSSSSQGLNHTRISNSYDALKYFERNEINLLGSGRQWFGDIFDIYTTRSYETDFNNPVSNGSATIRVQTAARSSVSSSFTVKVSNNTIGSLSHSSVNVNSQYTFFASIQNETFEVPYSQNGLEVELTFNKPTPAAKAWLDYIVVNARQKLAFGNSQLPFRDAKSVGEGEVTRFSIENHKTNMMVWDVTNFFNPVNLEYSIQNGFAEFDVETTHLKEFIAFTPAQAYSVSTLGDVPNQNIHGQPQPEMVIVTHPDFLSHAEELAQIHVDNSGLRTLVVTNQQVYNEFSSGHPDVSSIRNMMRMFYHRANSESDMPRYLLLFGDGSYDNKKTSASNTNYVLTYQSVNSLHGVSTFVSDDYFGLLDNNEGEASGLLDIGVGRIPCNTIEEANIAIRKIRQYLHPSSFGGWHNQLAFIGDDADGKAYMRDSEELALYVEENYPRYNVDRIYFDAYPLVGTTFGGRYPDVTDAIDSRVNQGTLMLTYVGHANPRWLAYEQVLTVGDILSWRNMQTLNVFITATCEFSRFDDYDLKSAGEHVLLSPLGGSVALVSTSRVVYANPNQNLNRNFYRYVFATRDDYVEGEGEKYHRLGDALRLAKIASGGGINKRSFLLLGDPALKLHYPSLELAITEINGNPISLSMAREIEPNSQNLLSSQVYNDTIRALSKVEILGRVTGSRSNESFNGEAEITLYDKAKEITTLNNKGGTPFVYTARENIIYKGRSSVVDDEFKATFIIPKDILYSYGTGRFSLFAHDGLITGSGFFEDFIVGGISDNFGDDTQGPDIEIYMNDRNFVSGGITDPNPKLLINLSDSSGINTTGTGIGHDLMAKIRGEMEFDIVLNDYYAAELDSYQKGKVEYPLSELNPGNYSVSVKAWDVYNNSNETEIEFTVKSDAEFKLNHVLNYPNPFTETTAFFFEHNQPYEDFEISIQVFSPSGKLVKTIEHFQPASSGYRIGPINWDGLDDFGDRIGRGVYFYRLRVRMPNGKTAEVYQKLVILK